MYDTENFRRLLEENLPFLQSKLLNLENFVPRADFEKLQQQLQNFDELKNNYEKLQKDFNALKEENKNLKSESGDTKNSRWKFADEVQNLTNENESLKRKNKKLSATNATPENLKSERDKLSASVQNLENENKTLQENLIALKMKIQSLTNQLKNTENAKLKIFDQMQDVEVEKMALQRANKILQEKISATSEKLEIFEKTAAELEYYKKSFAELDFAYKKYLALSENIRYNLEGIFGDGSTIQGFLFGAANENHLNEFWEYLRYSINDGRLSDDEKNNLSAIFDFCFDALNQSSGDKIFVRLQTEIGSQFDNRTMTHTSDSSQLGTVQKVFLEGYTNRIGDVVQPSLVLIGD